MKELNPDVRAAHGAYIHATMTADNSDIGENIAREEQLDAFDPLRHLREAVSSLNTDYSTNELLPPQLASVLNQTIQLSFPCSNPLKHQDEHVIHISLALDASPGCGGVAWRAGEVLAAYLATRGRKSLQGKTVLELGSGTGLVGLVAGLLGGTTWITDQIPLLDIMNHNIELNDLSSCVKAVELNWGESIPQFIARPPDIVLAADCVYHEAAFPLLVQTLSDLVLDDSTEVLLCMKKRRKADKRFFTSLKKKFTWVEVGDDPNREVYARESISLFRLFKKKS